MTKKCIICEESDAEFSIKGTNDNYCKECALDTFSDLDLLVKVEDQAKLLKQKIEERIEGQSSLDMEEENPLEDNPPEQEEELLQ